MLAQRILGVFCAIYIGLLGLLQVCEPWNRQSVVRNWNASSANARTRIIISITFFVAYLFAVCMLLVLWYASPSTQISLYLGVLEMAWLSANAIQVCLDPITLIHWLNTAQALTLVHVVQEFRTIRVPFCVALGVAVTLHSVGFAFSLNYQAIGRVFLVLGGSELPIFLFGSFIFLALRWKTLGVRLVACGLIAGSSLLANLIAIKLSSIEKLLQVSNRQL